MQLERLLTDLYETIGRADPRTTGKIASSVLETLPSAMDAVCLRHTDSLASQKTETPYLSASFTKFGSPVTEFEKVYGLMSPSKPNSLFTFALGASKTRTNEFKLEMNFLPSHSCYLLQATEGQNYRAQFLTLFQYRLQPLLRQGYLVVTAFEYLAIRFLHQLSTVRNKLQPSFRSELTGQTGYRNVYHALFNEYLTWFRERSESSSTVDCHTMHHNHRFMLCMAEEFLISGVARLESGGQRFGMSSAVVTLSSDCVLVISIDQVQQRPFVSQGKNACSSQATYN